MGSARAHVCSGCIPRGSERVSGDRVKRRIASTSRLAYRELAAVLQPREREVLMALVAYNRERLESPTAYELLERLRLTHPTYDPNSIRPRLTSLRDRGLIIGDQKRRCRVTGRLAWTWAVAVEDEQTRGASTDGAIPPVRQPVLDLHWAGGGSWSAIRR